VLTATLFLVTAPIAALIALPIALTNWVLFGDFRKILYTQPRVGYRGKTFWIYKFRTMRDGRGVDFDSWWKGADRRRVTRFGRFLRCTHLDELAQFLNVAKGEMCFIGPRPEMIEIHDWAEQEIAGFHARLAVKPGISGLSQVTVGYTGVEVDAYRRKLAADESYRRDFSLRLDLTILLRTAVWMLRGRGWKWSPRTGAGDVPDTSKQAA
jgi:lipopolysaccharide/colanic/teichoic acid biosynthesis glycosyltransferase